MGKLAVCFVRRDHEREALSRQAVHHLARHGGRDVDGALEGALSGGFVAPRQRGMAFSLARRAPLAPLRLLGRLGGQTVAVEHKQRLDAKVAQHAHLHSKAQGCQQKRAGGGRPSTEHPASLAAL